MPDTSPTYPEYIAQALLGMDEGLRALGMSPRALREAANLIRKQAEEINRYRSDRAYVLGHNDGWDAAMATGIPGQKEAGDA